MKAFSLSISYRSRSHLRLDYSPRKSNYIGCRKGSNPECNRRWDYREVPVVNNLSWVVAFRSIIYIGTDVRVWKGFADVFKTSNMHFGIGINGHFFQVSPFVFVQKQ